MSLAVLKMAISNEVVAKMETIENRLYDDVERLIAAKRLDLRAEKAMKRTCHELSAMVFELKTDYSRTLKDRIIEKLGEARVVQATIHHHGRPDEEIITNQADAVARQNEALPQSWVAIREI